MVAAKVRNCYGRPSPNADPPSAGAALTEHGRISNSYRLNAFMKKLLVLFLALVCYQSQAANPVLTIEGGKVQGVKADLKGVYVFRGIP